MPLSSTLKSLKEKLDNEIIVNANLNLDSIKDLALEFLTAANSTFVQDNFSTLTDPNSEIFQSTQMQLEENWAVLDTVRNFYHLLFESPEWNIEDYGIFLATTLKLAKYYDCKKLKSESRFHNFFTIPNYNVSLPDITFLYSTMNNEILSLMVEKETKEKDPNKPESPWEPSEFLNIPDSFKTCFKSQNKVGLDDGTANSIAGDFISTGAYVYVQETYRK